MRYYTKLKERWKIRKKSKVRGTIMSDYDKYPHCTHCGTIKFLAGANGLRSPSYNNESKLCPRCGLYTMDYTILRPTYYEADERGSGPFRFTYYEFIRWETVNDFKTTDPTVPTI
jgi:ribosomal protein S27AE